MKKIASALVIVAVLIVVLIYVNKEQYPADKEFDRPAEEKRLILQVTGNGETSNIRYLTLENSAQQGFFELPWTTTVSTSYAKVIASLGQGGTKVKCEIIDASSGNLLESDGPSSAVSCSYSTF